MRGVTKNTVCGILYGSACFVLFMIFISSILLAESTDTNESQPETPDAVVVQDTQVCNDSIALVYPNDHFHGHPEEQTGGRIGWLTCWDNQLMRVENIPNHKEGEPMMVVRCYCKEDYDIN